MLLVLSFLFTGPGNVRADNFTDTEEEIGVILDAKWVKFDSPPFMENSTTLVPFRPIFERMNLNVTWDEQTRTVKGEKGDTLIELQIDNPVAKVNGQFIKLPVAPKLKDGYTFVPLRFVSESAGAKVEWDPNRKDAMIYSKNEYTSTDNKFRFTAYGLWSNLDGIDSIQPEVDERAQDYISIEDEENIRLALKYFNYTMLFIAEEPENQRTKNFTPKQYVDSVKKKAAVSNDDILDEKQISVFGHDAVQLTYKNHLDWDSRIDTLIVFKSDSQFYTIRNSSYTVTYKNSLENFQQLLQTMKFNEKQYK
ncbi:copper amine oxidase N-terminal domain-containing protein [Paenibacillus sp. 1P03SA]|uniref:copper amine oxidase N-terminal domain-containing protein n=1 Tax=Paenibacillus sp. 1P03SA TaxID=3132294 RepID=UPI0039A1A944